ncbi:MAG: HIT family protein [Acidiferrobacterales bacterium]
MPNAQSSCLFCSIAADRVILSDRFAITIRDGFPVSAGHTLIIPRRHTGSFFDLYSEERQSLLFLLDEAKRLLDGEFCPDAYNIGINDGVAAGQTVPHLHIHLIPRYRGDCEDPRGGVRWIFPDRANYWSK